MVAISLAKAGMGAPSVTAASTKVKEFALPQSSNALVASKCAFTEVKVLVMIRESWSSYLTAALISVMRIFWSVSMRTALVTVTVTLCGVVS